LTIQNYETKIRVTEILIHRYADFLGRKVSSMQLEEADNAKDVPPLSKGRVVELSTVIENRSTPQKLVMLNQSLSTDQPGFCVPLRVPA
jgi:hypothetical protein